jgi:hypothetical protein
VFVYVCAFSCVYVQVKALRRADHPSKESYRLSLNKKQENSALCSKSGSKLPSVGATRKKKNGRIMGLKKINEFEKTWREAAMA